MWDVWDVGCSGCGMFRMWDVRYVGCLGVGCSGCEMFGMWDVQDVGCSGCEMFRMWDVWSVGCLGCGMFGMWDVGCGMFAGMWDVDLQNARSLWGCQGNEIVNNADVSNDDNAPSFKCKASIIGNTEDNGRKNGVKKAVPLKYLSNFWRSLEMPLINPKVELSLNWIERCVLTVANTETFKITDAKRYVRVVTLSAEDNADLSKLLRK